MNLQAHLAGAAEAVAMMAAAPAEVAGVPVGAEVATVRVAAAPAAEAPVEAEVARARLSAFSK